MIKFKKIALLSSLLLAFEAQADINMAVVAPMAGKYQAFGQELISGVRIAVDDINSRGGLNGQKINLITVDDQCDDRLAISTAQMMAVNSSKDKMNLVIGPYCSNAFSQVSDIYAKAKIFQIIPMTISEKNATQKHKGLVKMLGYKEKQGQDFFKFYQNNFEGKNVALVYDSSIRDVVDIAAAAQIEFKKNNLLDKLRIFNFNKYGKEYSKMSEDILADDTEIAYILGNSKQITKLSKNLKKENKKYIIFTNRYQVDEEYQLEMGKLAEGSYSFALPSLKDNPAFTETLVKLRLLGQEPEGLGVYSYSAVKLWQELVDKSDSFAYEKLAKTLEQNSFETPWGVQLFNNGNPQNTINYGIYQLNAGEYTQVY